jgi:hypothetical protein
VVFQGKQQSFDDTELPGDGGLGGFKGLGGAEIAVAGCPLVGRGPCRLLSVGRIAISRWSCFQFCWFSSAMARSCSIWVSCATVVFASCGVLLAASFAPIKLALQARAASSTVEPW